MNIEKIKSVIDRVFDNNEDVNPNTSGEIRASIETALDCLDKGELRVAEPLGRSCFRARCVPGWVHHPGRLEGSKARSG